MIFDEEGVGRVFNMLIGWLWEYCNDEVFLCCFFCYIIGFLNVCGDMISVDIRRSYDCIIYEICFLIICLLMIEEDCDVE